VVVAGRPARTSKGITMSKISRRAALAAAASGAGVLGAAAAARAAGDAPAGREGRPRIDHYTTPAGAELVPAVRLAHNPYRYTTLYSLKLPDLRAGDVVQAHSQFEATNDLGVQVMLAHAMLFHPKETIINHGPPPAKGRVISEYATENITPAMHHGFRTLVGSLAVPADGDGWVSVVIYAADLAGPPGGKLGVEKGYGGLRAIVFRNAIDPAPAADRPRR
jgi:hypothetical protein